MRRTYIRDTPHREQSVLAVDHGGGQNSKGKWTAADARHKARFEEFGNSCVATKAIALTA